MASSVWFEDDDFLDETVALLLTNRTFARQFGGILTPDDFKARTGATHANDRWILATKALDYIKLYRSPAKRLIIAELKQYCEVARVGGDKRKKLLRLARGYLESPGTGLTSVSAHINEFKAQVLKANALEELTMLQSSGMLDDDKWAELTRKALFDAPKGDLVVNYFASLKDRNLRRLRGDAARYPRLYMEPFDLMTRAISRGHLGLVMAPWKGRKSLCLLWIAIAYCLQGLRVLFYTLEDPLSDVEDRLDAMITRVEVKELANKTGLVAKRFPRFRRFVTDNLRIVDATAGGLTVNRVETDVERLDELGEFVPDAVLIDYDDEIVPSQKHKERRFEFAQIYRDLRQFAAKTDRIVWTAAQCNKEAEGKKIVTGRDLAEDVSKARKVNLAIGIGAGDWGKDSNYLYIAAHKHDEQYRGCHIVGDPECMLFYDHDATMRAYKKNKKP